MKLQTCRYVGTPEVEDAFCAECLVPCSTTSAAVGPHVRHNVVPLETGLEDASIQTLFIAETQEFTGALSKCTDTVPEVAAGSLSAIGDAVKRIADIDASIERLRAERAAAVDSIADVQQRALRSLRDGAQRAVHLMRFGHLRVLHGLQHSLQPVIVDDARFHELSETLQSLAAECKAHIQASGKRVAETLAAASVALPQAAAVYTTTSSSSSSSVAEKLQSNLAQWAAVVMDCCEHLGGDSSLHSSHHHHQDMRRAQAATTTAASSSAVKIAAELVDDDSADHDLALHPKLTGLVGSTSSTPPGAAVRSRCTPPVSASAVMPSKFGGMTSSVTNSSDDDSNWCFHERALQDIELRRTHQVQRHLGTVASSCATMTSRARQAVTTTKATTRVVSAETRRDAKIRHLRRELDSLMTAVSS